MASDALHPRIGATSGSLFAAIVVETEGLRKATIPLD
jgi:hypothetical protein